jgi:ethanolamine utilization protein EutN
VQLARVEGKAISTVKHKSFHGARLLIVQPLDIQGRDEGEPLLVVDQLGASRGDQVIISSDGAGARKILNDRSSPVRWMVMGLRDPEAGR